MLLSIFFCLSFKESISPYSPFIVHNDVLLITYALLVGGLMITPSTCTFWKKLKTTSIRWWIHTVVEIIWILCFKLMGEGSTFQFIHHNGCCVGGRKKKKQKTSLRYSLVFLLLLLWRASSFFWLLSIQIKRVTKTTILLCKYHNTLTIIIKNSSSTNNNNYHNNKNMSAPRKKQRVGDTLNDSFVPLRITRNQSSTRCNSRWNILNGEWHSRLCL